MLIAKDQNDKKKKHRKHPRVVSKLMIIKANPNSPEYRQVPFSPPGGSVHPKFMALPEKKNVKILAD